MCGEREFEPGTPGDAGTTDCVAPGEDLKMTPNRIKR